jgi:glucose-1-phosphate cytidylyltransferase
LQVVILCGGLGTRLADETEFRPKPMVEIGGRPIMWHIMKLYSHHGLTDFVLCLGYKGDVIRNYFLNYDLMNSDVRVQLGTRTISPLETFHDEKQWTVTLAETGERTLTAGRIRRAARYVEGPRFMVTYGDCVSNVNVAALLAFHEAHGRLATVTGIRPVNRFGELRLEGDLVSEFREKPQLDEGRVNGGFFVFERAALDYLDDGSLEKAPLERLARDGQLAVYRHDGYWFPMDTMREKRMLEEEWATGNAAWKVW